MAENEPTDNGGLNGTVVPKGLPSRDLAGVASVVLDGIDEVARSTLAPDKKMAAVVRGVGAYATLYRTQIAIRNNVRATGTPLEALEGPKSSE